MPRYRNRRIYGRRRNAPRQKPRRVFSEGPDGGCVKITVGKSRIIMWNNCEGPLTIKPGEGLRLDVVRRVTYDLDFGTATAIFAEPVQRRNELKEDEAPRPEDYDWV